MATSAASRRTAESVSEGLFDWSFERFATPRLIKIAYVIGMIGITLWSATVFVGIARTGAGGFFLSLVLVPIAWLLGVIYLRVMLELFAVIFRISDSVAAISVAVDADSGAMARSNASPLPSQSLRSRGDLLADQRSILQWVREQGPATLEQIADGASVSTPRARTALRQLQADGDVTLSEGRFSAI